MDRSEDALRALGAAVKRVSMSKEMIGWELAALEAAVDEDAADGRTPDSDDDSETSFNTFSRNMRIRDRGRGRDREPATTYASSIPLSSSTPIQRLPTRWSEQDRNGSLTISPDGLELHFNGTIYPKLFVCIILNIVLTQGLRARVTKRLRLQERISLFPRLVVYTILK